MFVNDDVFMAVIVLNSLKFVLYRLFINHDYWLQNS